MANNNPPHVEDRKSAVTNTPKKNSSTAMSDAELSEDNFFDALSSSSSSSSSSAAAEDVPTTPPSPTVNETHSDSNILCDALSGVPAAPLSQPITNPTTNRTTKADGNSTKLSQISAKLNNILQVINAVESRQGVDAANTTRQLGKIERKQKKMEETIGDMYGVMACVHDELRPNFQGLDDDDYDDWFGDDDEDEGEEERTIGRFGLREQLIDISDNVSDLRGRLIKLEERFGADLKLIVTKAVVDVMTKVKLTAAEVMLSTPTGST